MIASLPIEATRARFQTRPSNSDDKAQDERGNATATAPNRFSRRRDFRLVESPPEVEAGWLQDRQLGGLGTFENPTSIDSGLAVGLPEAWRVTN
jgi:hypothetical protein